MHKKMLQQINLTAKTINTTDLYLQLLQLLQDKKYTEALLLGCQKTTSADRELSEVLAVVIGYAPHLDIDLNAKDGRGYTAAYYARPFQV